MQEGETNIIQFTTNTRVACWQWAKSVSTAGGYFCRSLRDGLRRRHNGDHTTPHHTTRSWLALESKSVTHSLNPFSLDELRVVVSLCLPSEI